MLDSDRERDGRERSFTAAFPFGERLGLASLRRFLPGEVIRSPFATPHFYGIVHSGFVKAFTVVGERAFTQGLLFENGLIASTGIDSIDATQFQALTESRVYCLDYASLTQLRQTESKVDRYLLDLAAEELRRSREWIGILGRYSVEEKVAAFLLLLARRNRTLSQSPSSETLLVEVPIKRSEIAELLGTTTESVSRTITGLRNARIIRLEDLRHWLIVDHLALSELAG